MGARVREVARQRHAARLGDDGRREHHLQELPRTAGGQRLDALHQGEQLELVSWQEPVVDEVRGLGVEPQREIALQLGVALPAVVLGCFQDGSPRLQRLRRVDGRQLGGRDHPGQRVYVAADGASAETPRFHERGPGAGHRVEDDVARAR